MLFNLKNHINHFLKNDDGLAFMEGIILLPFLIVLLMGMYDIGQAIIINQKITSAAHMAGDLLTRKLIVSDNDLNDAVGLSQLIIDPYDRTKLGIDIVGIRYDISNSPEAIWRHTHNMTPSADLPSSAEGLGTDGEGLVAIATKYEYTPYFTSPLAGSFTMEELSYLRGRKNSFVRYQGGTP